MYVSNGTTPYALQLFEEDGGVGGKADKREEGALRMWINSLGLTDEKVVHAWKERWGLWFWCLFLPFGRDSLSLSHTPRGGLSVPVFSPPSLT